MGDIKSGGKGVGKRGRGRPAGVKSKKRRGKPAQSYEIYIWKVLKQVHPSCSISKTSMSVLNSFMSDTFERIAGEAGKLCRYNKKATMTAREIQSASRLVLPGELAKHAISEGTKAITKFSSSR